MMFRKIKQSFNKAVRIALIPLDLCVLLLQERMNKKELDSHEKDVERKRNEIYAFRLKKLKAYQTLVEAIDPNLIEIIASNTALNNLLAVQFLQTQQVWKKERAILILFTAHILERSNKQVSPAFNRRRKLFVPFGEFSLEFEMFAYDNGDLHCIIHEIELGITLRKGNTILHRDTIEMGTSLGSSITSNLFEGFVLQKLPSIIPILEKYF
ncbi:MAG: hypothetical protein MK212_00910 [Saprospiraceae bacterium]|nr:hypothetical protein [Saprospiraceae bacterium]